MSRFDRWALIALLSLWAGFRPWDAFLPIGPAQVQLSALLIGLCLYAVCYLARPLLSHQQNFPDATVTMPPNLDPGSSLLLQSPVLGSWRPFGASILVAFFVVKAAGEALGPYYAKGFYAQEGWKGVPDYEPLVNFAAIFFLAYVLALLELYGVPPLRKLRALISIYWVVAMAYISVPVSPLFSLAATCVFFFVGLCFVASSVIQIAHGNVQQLKELHELAPTQFARQGTRPLLIHMTDVHITSNEQTERIGGGIGGIRCFRQSLEFVSQSRPKYLIISGDLTDTGCSEEWQQAGELIANFSESEAPFLVLAPGNHDLSESYDEMSRVDQMRLYFESISRISPRMISVVELTVADIIQKVYSAAAPPLVAEIGTILKDIYITGSKPATRFPPVSSSTRRERRAKAENVDWQSIARDKLIDQWFRTYGGDLFPLRIYDDKQKTMIFVLNSVMRAGTFGESALGFLGTKQLSRLYGHLRTLPQEAENVLVVTHHSPFRRAGEWQLVLSPHHLGRSFTEVMDYCFLSHQAEEARAFIAKLSACADQYQSVRFFLMCGHRHTAGAGYAGRVLVLEGGALCEEGVGAWIVYANGGRVSIDRENLC